MIKTLVHKKHIADINNQKVNTLIEISQKCLYNDLHSEKEMMLFL